MSLGRRPTHPKKPPIGNRGQASIMIGMMVLTFLLFFAFVVNVGMLVHAKINLQNAADLAAYAGAATQARQLNNISYLNFEMRRQYKKFLFRYYVIGNMAQDSFPRPGNNTNLPLWTPGASASSYGVPTVCVIFNAADNFCHLARLAKITIPPSNILDSINETLIGQLKSIEQIRQNNCLKIGTTNQLLDVLWLYNTDPDLTNLYQQLVTAGSEFKDVLNVIHAMGTGLGLVPKELMLKFRTDTLANYINHKAEKGMTKDKADAMKTGAPDQGSVERTLQAFYSAYNTLGDSLWLDTDTNPIQMDEILPAGTSGASLIRLIPIEASFDTWALHFVLAGGVSAGASGQPGDCQGELEPISVKNVVLGVAKDPKIMTYYAVKLTATARLLFSPFAPFQMTAYAAAQPFGSRIGPDLSATVESNLTYQGQPTTSFIYQPPGAPAPQANAIPNLPIGETDKASATTGWSTPAALTAFYNGFTGGTPDAALQLISGDTLSGAYQRAMVPNPWEGNRYNIINDLGSSDPFMRNFDSSGIYAFWAPLFPLDQLSGGLTQTLQDALAASVLGSPPQLLTTLQLGLSQYIDRLRAGAGSSFENQEGFNIARISDPFSDVEFNSGGTSVNIIKGMADILLNDPKKVKTSWNNVNDANYRALGRVGYSVKFDSFDSLTAHKSSTNGTDVWGNSMDLSDDEKSDFEMIQH